MRVSIAAVICAAGSSSRMGGQKKEYLPLPSRVQTVLGAAVSAFVSCPQIGPIVITLPPGDENAARACLGPELLAAAEGRLFFIDGGQTRRASVRNALLFLESFHPSHALIHDGARPWIKQDLIERIIDAAIRHGAVIPALPLVETPKELDPEKPEFIKRHLKREGLYAAQTPQGFRFPEILAAYEKAGEREYTDDAEVWGEFIGQVAVIPGDPANRKITYPEDLR
jgi:2-C-methyl-D-erythritol 4-phosphate cytidylyltransferase/2-C-methyl-D-erythritol 4-phosphate cytidylyltransferase/2-C-methyl-D-erythritol 2,4-cyclodiphosphate synthase